MASPAFILLVTEVMNTSVWTDDVAAPAPNAPEIQALAYRYYLEEGRPEGRALDHWVRAEQTLSMNSNGSRDLNGVPHTELARFVAEGGHVPETPSQGQRQESGMATGVGSGSPRASRGSEQRRRRR